MGRIVVVLLAVSVWLHGFLLGGGAVAQEDVEPVRLIYDTDMGNDVDDAMALARHPCASGPGRNAGCWR